MGRSAVLVPAAIVIAFGATALRRPLHGLGVVVAILGAILIQNAVKAIVARPRPRVQRLEHVSGTSYPSGHATEATAFFVMLATALLTSLAPRWSRRLVAATTLLVIAAVALSRVYLGVHYPTDVVAGHAPRYSVGDDHGANPHDFRPFSRPIVILWGMPVTAAIIDTLLNTVPDTVAHLGLFGIFFLMLLEAACIPRRRRRCCSAGLPSARGDQSLIAVILTELLGNLAGSLLAFLVGATAGMDRWQGCQ